MSDSNGRAPLVGTQPGHRRLFSEIYQRIHSGSWAPDTQIPSERELCEQYGVSRTMVRQALLEAERQGILVRVPGRGTFVAWPRVHQELGRMQTFRSTLAGHDITPGRQLLGFAWRTASAEVARLLRVPTGDNVLAVQMLGLGDGKPMALFESHLPAGIGERLAPILAGDAANERATNEMAAELMGIKLLVAEQTFEVMQFDASSAHLLDVMPGAAGFRVSSIFRTPEGDPIESRLAFYPGSRYTFHIVRELALD